MLRPLAVPLALAILSLAACAGRRAPQPPVKAAAPTRGPAALRAGLEAEKQRAAHLPMLSQEEAKKAMPAHARWPELPTLMLVAARQPKSMEAVLATAKTLRREGGLDQRLLNDVFWVVSSANDCFY